MNIIPVSMTVPAEHVQFSFSVIKNMDEFKKQFGEPQPLWMNDTKDAPPKTIPPPKPIDIHTRILDL